MKTIKGFVKKYWITVLIFAGLVLLYYYVADVKMNVGKYMNVGDAIFVPNNGKDCSSL